MPQAAARAVDKVTAAAARAWHAVPREVAIAALAGAAIVFAGYTVHSVWVRAPPKQPAAVSATAQRSVHWRGSTPKCDLCPAMCADTWKRAAARMVRTACASSLQLCQHVPGTLPYPYPQPVRPGRAARARR